MDFINVINYQKNNPFRFKVKNRKNSVNINLCYKYAAAISGKYFYLYIFFPPVVID